MVKITIKCDSPQLHHKLSLLKLFRDLNLEVGSIVKIQDKFLVYFNENFDQDHLFSDETRSKLSGIGCSLILPSNLRAKRSVLVFRVDNEIYEHDVNDILREIEECNENLEIDEVVKFPNSKTLKILFNSEKAARFAEQRGIHAFYLHMSPRNIERDLHVDVKNCFKCYKIDDHIAADCTKDDDFKICSLCSSVDHTYRDCEATFKKCVNCKGNHGALSFSCPIRKQALREKRKSVKSQKSQVTTAPSQTNFRPTTADFPSIEQSNEADVRCKAYMAIVVASLKETENPGTFKEVLDELIRANKLSPFNMGKISAPRGNPETLKETFKEVLDDLIRAKILTPEDSSAASDNDKHKSVPSVAEKVPVAVKKKVSSTYCSSDDDFLGGSAAPRHSPAGNLTPPNTNADTSIPQISVPSPIVPVAPVPDDSVPSPSRRTVSTPIAGPISQANTTEATAATVLSSPMSQENYPTSQPTTKRDLRSNKIRPPVITFYSTKNRIISADNFEQLLREKKIHMFSNCPKEVALAALKIDPSCASVKVISDKEYKKLLLQ